MRKIEVGGKDKLCVQDDKLLGDRAELTAQLFCSLAQSARSYSLLPSIWPLTIQFVTLPSHSYPEPPLRTEGPQSEVQTEAHTPYI